MDKVLKIEKADGTWLSLPKCSYALNPESVYKEYTMADQSKRMSFKGSRIKISGNLEYIPQDILAEYNRVARSGGYTKVEYTDEQGRTLVGSFKITPFAPTVFKYINNSPIWTDVSIEMEAQEVI